MRNLEIADYRQAVEGLHGGRASFVETVRVVEEFEGERAWDGDVHVFALEEHPTAQKAYAWSVPVPGSERRRFYAVLHEGPVDSPETAVRASVVQEYRRLENPERSDNVSDVHDPGRRES